MRAMKRLDGKWVTEHPEDLSAWLWANNGLEAVVIDDSTKTYYCGRPDTVEQFREAWKKEAKKNDKRTALMFIEANPLWCQHKALICSERQNCTAECDH
jgi:hypothetical protein